MFWVDVLKRSSIAQAGAQCNRGANVRVRVGPPREEEQCCELRPNLHPAGHQGLGHLSLGRLGLGFYEKDACAHTSSFIWIHLYLFSFQSDLEKPQICQG